MCVGTDCMKMIHGVGSQRNRNRKSVVFLAHHSFLANESFCFWPDWNRIIWTTKKYYKKWINHTIPADSSQRRNRLSRHIFSRSLLIRNWYAVLCQQYEDFRLQSLTRLSVIDRFEDVAQVLFDQFLLSLAKFSNGSHCCLTLFQRLNERYRHVTGPCLITSSLESDSFLYRKKNLWDVM